MFEKLEILSDSAKYDVSCASSGSERDAPSGGFGNAKKSGICHTWSSDGRCISLLKILMSNVCVYDCAYCVNRVTNDIRRATFSPQEIADLTINFYRRNYIEGLFLSSGIIKSPNHTMERMLEALRLLRDEHRFGGYIHLKLIPGSDEHYIREASVLADRVSANIELPSEGSLQALAPQKSKASVFTPLLSVKNYASEIKNLPIIKSSPKPHIASMSTQMIIGASPESDYEILRLSSNLYSKALLKRVYFSAYVPINSDKNLPVLATPPLLREHRLYQADWLMRFYGFGYDEIVSDALPNLDERFDPKTGWALRNLHLFPMDINRVDKEMLLRIPGVGVRSALKILKARRFKELREEDLKKLGVSLKRAKYFAALRGKYLGGTTLNEQNITNKLIISEPKKRGRQSTIYDFLDNSFSLALSGEL